jgi:hypothetical protein
MSLLRLSILPRMYTRALRLSILAHMYKNLSLILNIALRNKRNNTKLHNYSLVYMHSYQ